MHRSLTITAVLIAGLMLTTGPADARGRRSGSKQLLTRTGADDDAIGLMRFFQRRASDARLRLVVRNLEQNTTYEVVVDGVKVGEFETREDGEGHLGFRARPRSRRDQLLGFDPRGAVMTIRSASGDDVLEGRISDDRPTDPEKGICCVPDDDRVECEDRTPERCAAEGGAMAAATSCLPNPCDDATPLPNMDVICCLPDDSGPECEDRTPAECAVQGGVVVEAASCTPNPCAPILAPNADIQCCLPDDSGFECEDRTTEECAAQGGVDVGPGICSLDSCANLLPPPDADIQCCVPDDGSFKCEDRTPAECAARGGVDKGPGTCQPDPCI